MQSKIQQPIRFTLKNFDCVNEFRLKHRIYILTFKLGSESINFLIQTSNHNNNDNNIDYSGRKLPVCSSIIRRLRLRANNRLDVKSILFIDIQIQRDIYAECVNNSDD